MTVLDLFSGIGGFALGLQRAGFTTKYFCEIDPYCRQVLAQHWPTVPCFEDVRTLRGADLGPIDLICGGFPCQDISVAGKGAGLSGARSGLWSEYARLIQEIKPKYVLIENVAVLRSRGLDQILREIAALGYDAEWHCIPACAVGAPHRRDRIWIVAYAQGQRINGDQRVVCTREWRPRSALSREFEQPSDVSDTQSDRTQGGFFQPKGLSQLREDGLAQSLADPNCGGCSSQQYPRGSAEENSRGQGYFEQSSPMLNALADPHRGRFQQREPQGEQEAGGTDDVADSHTGFSIRENAEIQSRRNAANNGGEDVSDPNNTSTTRQREHSRQVLPIAKPAGFDGGSSENWWAVEPTMGELVNGVSGGLVRFNGRVATQIPNRVNKLRGLGNAVVPQIVEVLGRMIMQYEAERLRPQDEESA